MGKTLTLEGLADEREGGALVADGGGVNEGLYGASGAPGGVPAEHAPEHRGRLSPREERGALRRVLARHPARVRPVLSGRCGTATAMLRRRRHGWWAMGAGAFDLRLGGLVLTLYTIKQTRIVLDVVWEFLVRLQDKILSKWYITILNNYY
jgi:hypothetical protein